MRVYTFTHFMLSTMAQGIQAGHAKDELFNNYRNTHIEENKVLFDWSINHKTHVSLSGGISSDMEELWTFLCTEENPYPLSNFHEDEDSLKGIMTSIAMVLPERIYEVASMIKRKTAEFNREFLYPVEDESMGWTEDAELEALCQSYGSYTDFEKELILRLPNYRLAS